MGEGELKIETYAGFPWCFSPKKDRGAAICAPTLGISEILAAEGLEPPAKGL